VAWVFDESIAVYGLVLAMLGFPTSIWLAFSGGAHFFCCFTDLSGRPISEISFEQLPEDATLEYEHGGVRYRPNLLPIGHLIVRFEANPAEPTAATATHYLIGRKAGELRITTAAPVEQ
jgi:hypothetical protein